MHSAYVFEKTLQQRAPQQDLLPYPLLFIHEIFHVRGLWGSLLHRRLMLHSSINSSNSSAVFAAKLGTRTHYVPKGMQQ